jgi:spore germination cell wall hydrolase CwlJ-like protein
MAQSLTLSRPIEGIRLRAARLKLRARQLWRAYPRETLGLGLLGLATALAIGGAAHSTPELPRAQAAPPPAAPLLIRQLPPAEAVQVNQAIPITSGPNPAAAPFHFTGNSAARTRALECLASAVSYEAGSQDDNGERAVAQVVLNRVRHPTFPASVCSVVYEGSTRATGCQFTFTCDGSLYRRPDAEGWRRAYRIAEQALNGYVYAPVGYATHYHANYVVPYWASTLAKNAVVGAHIFYRWAGGWGRPAAFTNRYSGHEPDVAALRSAALAAEAATANQPESVAEAIEDIPGAEPITITPSMRGDKRVAVRFNLVARNASDQAQHKEYVERVGASDNLRWSLSSDIVAADEKPLGKPRASNLSTVATGGASTAAAAGTAATTAAGAAAQP